RRHTRCYRDWSSDVCSSDLIQKFQGFASLWLAFREPPRTSTPNLRYLRKVYLADIRAIRQPRLPSRKPACRKNLRSSIHGGANRSEERRVGKQWRSVGSKSG